MKSRYLGFVAAGLLALPSPGNSDSIVDTGAPVVFGCGLSTAEMRAGLFSVDAVVEINAIHHFVQVPAAITVTVTVRTDAAGLPGEVLFATEAILQPTSEFEWVGADGLNWALPAGTYWVTMEHLDPEAMDAYTRLIGTSATTYPARPLAAEAIGFAPDFDDWQVAIGKTGWRILGTVTPDP
jgi:hypothetical protein